jgi:hypothetical protein
VAFSIGPERSQLPSPQITVSEHVVEAERGRFSVTEELSMVLG